MSSSGEIFRAKLNGRGSQSIAAGPLVAADHAAHLAGLPVSKVVQSAKLLAEALGQAQERYNGDFLIVFSDVAVEAEAMGCRLEFPEDAPPHVIGTVQPENLRVANPHSDGRMPMMIEATATLVQRFGDQVPVFASLKDPFSAAALACGTEEFFTLLVTDPEKAKFAIGIAYENQQRYLLALIETGAHIIIGAPLASGGLLGSKHFREFAREPIADLMDLGHQSKRLMGLHSCGDAEPILDDLVGIPADFLSLESFDLFHWKKLAALSKIPALMGYFPTGLLLSGTPEEIYLEVRSEIEYLRGYPHILASACDVPQKTLPTKVHCFMEAARNREAPLKS